jgi:transcriptional regulator with XRE-family HTH domain
LGDVIKKERERSGLTLSQAAERLKIQTEDYVAIEGGQSPAEHWGPIIATLAMKFEVPMARLLSANGRSDGAYRSKVGSLLQSHRLASGFSPEALAHELGLDPGEYAAAEAGTAPLDQIAPWLLAFAELVDQPVFNFFYPCGLPLERIDDYP